MLYLSIDILFFCLSIQLDHYYLLGEFQIVQWAVRALAHQPKVFSRCYADQGLWCEDFVASYMNIFLRLMSECPSIPCCCATLRCPIRTVG